MQECETIHKATYSYTDDIIVDESIASAQSVVKHLMKYGLRAKDPVSLDDGMALGLKIHRDQNGRLVYLRGNEIPVVSENMTKRQLFSLCGKLVGHYPVAKWLRIACSYIKRRADCDGWDDEVSRDVLQMA